ncbi:MAG: glucoamylase family protein [Deltaproteobacteria bacterium]|nr:glucoamylase family protein [Deltaproteobacteria bacterium]
MAATHEVGRVGREAEDLLGRLGTNARVLAQAYSQVSEAITQGKRITPAAEWLLDNYHLIEEQVRTARRHLPRGYVRELPCLTNSTSPGRPRVYDIAIELISHADGRVDMEGVQAFITAYQTVTPLGLGELWAIPIMLRLALIENLRRVSVDVTAGQNERARACLWADQMIAMAAKEPGKVVLVLADMVRDVTSPSNAFAAELASRVQARGPSLAIAMSWLEQRLAEHGQTVEQVFQLTSQTQASAQVSFGNSIGSLRFLGATDWREFVEATSVVEHALRTDPAGVYPQMDFATRDRYRHVVEQIAKASDVTQAQVASCVLEAARERDAAGDKRGAHVGHFLIGEGHLLVERAVSAHWPWLRRVGSVCERLPLLVYLGAIAATTAIATSPLVWWAKERGFDRVSLIAWSLLIALCASQTALALVHWAATILVKPRVLPRLDFSEGIPPQHRTVVAVPALLTDLREVDELLEGLEVRMLANRDNNVVFALLTDLRDAAAESVQGDADVVERARAGITTLNERYAGQAVFFLYHRDRRFNPREGVWMGWERKRGKLEQFNEALRGDDSGFALIVGPKAQMANIKYVVALDADTQLPRDAARLLVGTLAHPLNRPVFDDAGRVVSGYSILQPGLGITMPSARRSLFSRLFAGESGIDPYTRAVSDIYQDLFDEGSFVGKGIYDVDALRKALRNRFPENRILSHDLLEGAHARAGLVSDVVLFEDYPYAHAADVSRRSRWIRGDWQITPWLWPRVPSAASGQRLRNPLSGLSRWKLLDNLRRSLLPVALLAALVIGWLLPGAALLHTLIVVSIFALPGLLTAATDLARRPSDLPFNYHALSIARALARQLLRELFNLAMLPYDAFISIDAITRTGFRVLVSHKRLLQWRTASDAQRSAHADVAGTYVSMWSLPITAMVLAFVILQRNPEALPVAGCLLALWMFAPAASWWVSQPLRPAQPAMSKTDVAFLRMVARRTWRFFETFVGPDDNDLPPDNVQEDPPQGIAHRTSPTNIGMSLLANLAAFDFGYIAGKEVVARTQRTLATMDRLQRHRGHFYNWYDTKTLEPLRPLYVSTVDSGNLAGHLLTLAAGLREMETAPAFSPARVFEGLSTTLEVIIEVAGTLPTASAEALSALQSQVQTQPGTLLQAHNQLHTMVSRAAELAQSALDVVGDETHWWIDAFESQCRGWLAELEALAPWLLLSPPEILLELPGLTPLALARLEVGNEAMPALRDAVAASAERAASRLTELRALGARCTELADLEYGFLYDDARRLLSIGYNVADHRLDASFYDLLASEARLASYVAIAQGKLPQEHWFSLGRLLTTSAGKQALLSWSGSMFEYLMPLLVMPTYEQTLLDETYRAVVERQVEYGRERGVPWGVSESGYNKTDAHLNYQYRAFGVPGLGFKRGLADDLVVAPYASAMGLMINPTASSANLRTLAKQGIFASYGFYEAIDYTTPRLPPGQDSVVVKSFMAHHQGMALLSLVYLLCERPMQRRFASDPAFLATDLLLQERVPKATAVFPHLAEVAASRGPAAENKPNLRFFNTWNTEAPEVHLLSNGQYHVMVTNAGGGSSRWRDLSVTRWREDPTRDHWGTFCYVRDLQTGTFWSAAHHPTRKAPSGYEVIFSEGRAEYRRRDGDIETFMEISVSPEDDLELRRISITNRGATPRRVELTSYAEVVLAMAAADVAHPAFSNLFVQTELLTDRQAILCTRRPRSGGERPPWMMHSMTVHGTASGGTSFETSRTNFIGRGRTVADPVALHEPTLGNSEGSVLDPIVSIRNTLVVQPDETSHVHIVTGMAETREGALALVEKYQDRHLADRVFELSWTQSQVVLRRLDVTEADTQLFGRLASNILYANAAMRAPASVIMRNRSGQSGLWGYGISGDLPIVLLRVADLSALPLVKQLVQAHVYWRLKGLATDLVIWNDDQSGYRQELHDGIINTIGSSADANLLDKRGGIFVRRTDQMSDDDKLVMQTVARVIVADTGGTLANQMDRRARGDVRVPPLAATRKRRAEPSEAASPATPSTPQLYAWNGLGGFSPDGREYVITTGPGLATPAPWVNVIANPWFGTVVSETGAAYTWCENAHSYRLSPWHNDPVSDPSGECFYVRDEEDGRVWSPTPQPAPAAAPYTTRHGFGYSTFACEEGGIATTLTTFVATDAPVKFVVLKVSNRSGRQRRVSLMGFVELVMGAERAINLPHIVTEVDPKSGALFARNAYSSDFAARVAFMAGSEPARSVSGDRLEFLGRAGAYGAPACMTRSHLSGRVGAGFDPCFAMQLTLDLGDGQEREIAFMFGSGRDVTDARTLVTRFRGTGPAHAALALVNTYWQATLGAVSVQTPDVAVNVLANGWLLYQVLAARLWARSGFYQSGGAFGFRDQLQDSLALVHAQPQLLRSQILRCAEHQFREGDVQHWWHPPLSRGVRTHISDDYLWLPFAVCRYIGAVGDTGVLEERAAFLEGRVVKRDEDSYYDLPGRSDELGTVYEHCVRAIKHGLRMGAHGLPLMGSGDWNDGMNLVGEHGKGESVWLAFFLFDVLQNFSRVAQQRGDEVFAQICVAEAAKLKTNIEEHAWDGAWYLRAFFDDGQAMGSASSVECQIDSLPQSWSILSGAGQPQRVQQALAALDERLVNRPLGLIKLFDPAFDTSPQNPGYVKGYVPGVRENGGQYTHAAVWAVMAFAAAGDAERAWELFGLINPVNHGNSAKTISVYKVEPYVVAADVYTNPQHAGRGGWTWYTGSAGWMYQLIIESLLGLHLEVDHLRLAPLLPKAWPSVDVRYRFRNTTYHITMRRRSGSNSLTRVVCDGAEQPDKTVPLVDDGGNHEVQVDLG